MVDQLHSDVGPRHELNLVLIVVHFLRVKFDDEDFAKVGIGVQQHNPVLNCRKQELVLLSFKFVFQTLQIFECTVVLSQKGVVQSLRQ